MWGGLSSDQRRTWERRTARARLLRRVTSFVERDSRLLIDSGSNQSTQEDYEAETDRTPIVSSGKLPSPEQGRTT